MKILDTEETYQSKWLKMMKTHYYDKNGGAKSWEFVTRTNEPRVVSVVCKDQNTGEFLLIKQYRIPIESVQIEFPAGLVDDHETLEEGALRELEEETGYTGEILSISNPLPKTAGLTNEATHLVFCSVDKSVKNEPEMDASEEITSFWSTPENFMKIIQSKEYEKIKTSSDVYFFMRGFTLRKD
ncbi:MAG: NUDIX domain-containing protein [Candidatus Kariarchaeaceae archaeon]